ncbi:tyrosine-type recombinase/integrase [Paenibacillus prosopidis]|uniref:Site-specific recombinase XerD n=1 Tax=Paenibacillus prosopidis TaxID=630520 RepID=A0A368VTQ4_9BACL|nr:site-specific integrase [Paenibacillus prosopidis]RCW45414.1 site-specific recombinase XerD [Paenibacillus prosopidis]
MAIPINSNYNIEEICSTFGIEREDFLRLISGKQEEPSNLKTIIEVIDEFMGTVKKSNKSATTISYYASFLSQFKSFLNEVDPSIDLLGLTEVLFNEFILEKCISRDGGSLSRGSINTYQSIIRELLFFSLIMKYINIDLRPRFEKLTTDILPRYIPDDVASNIIIKSHHTSRPHLNNTIIIFLLGTGCRLSEVTKLRINQFDVLNNLIFIKKSKGYKDRYIPMYPEVKNIVLSYLQRTGIKEWNRNNEKSLFTKGFGEDRPPLSNKYIQRTVKSILKEIQMDQRFSVHSFRHTFAVNCLKIGMRIDILAQVMGHKSIETTRVYTKLLPHDLKNDVMEKFPFPFEKLMQKLIPNGGATNGETN